MQISRTSSWLAATGIVALAAVQLIPFADVRAGDASMTDIQAREFFNTKGCNACHAVAETHLAPSFTLIALRYRDRSTQVINALAEKIIHGGAGNWGLVPMVNNPNVTLTEARMIAVWILAKSDVNPVG